MLIPRRYVAKLIMAHAAISKREVSLKEFDVFDACTCS